MPDLRLPSQAQNVTATAWWQRHMCVNSTVGKIGDFSIFDRYVAIMVKVGYNYCWRLIGSRIWSVKRYHFQLLEWAIGSTNHAVSITCHHTVQLHEERNCMLFCVSWLAFRLAGWNVTSAGWQVTLCDSIWHVSSGSSVATSVSELLYPCYVDFTVLWHSWLPSGRASGPKKMNDEVLAWLSVWNEVQMICIWSSWCRCHPIISCLIKIQIGLTFLVSLSLE